MPPGPGTVVVPEVPNRGWCPDPVDGNDGDVISARSSVSLSEQSIPAFQRESWICVGVLSGALQLVRRLI